MSLLTPGRRRISPRTKQRYYIVKNFFRKALGTTPREGDRSAASDGYLSPRILSNNEKDLKITIEKKTNRDSQRRRHLETTDCNQTRYHSEIENVPKLQVSRPNYDDKLKSVSYNCHYDENCRRGERSTRHRSNIKRPEDTVEPGQSNQLYPREGKKRRTSTEYKQYLLAKEIKRRKRNERHQSEYTLRNQEAPTRNANPILDKQFIDDIIRKQYNSVKVYCNSQLSAPLCRDLDYSEEFTRQALDLCSCIDAKVGKAECSRRHPLHHIQSDIRLCPPDERDRPKHRARKKNVIDESNNFSLDLVPVKEKSTPESRNKFEGKPLYDSQAAVPISPRSHRPRLNLQAQCQDYDATTTTTDPTELSASPKEQYDLNLKHLELNTINNRIFNEEVLHSTNSNFYPNRTAHCHKNDVTLTEIKDIIQNFLHEIKKDSVDTTHNQGITKMANANIEQRNADLLLPPTHVKCPPQYPYVPSCYPILPMCSMNCAQSSYFPPKTNFSCPHCQPPANQNQEDTNNEAAKTSVDEVGAEELIKEIYKIIKLQKESAQNVNENSSANFDCQSHMSNKYCHDAHDSNTENCDTVDSRVILEDNDYSASVIDKLSVIATRSDAPLKVDSLLVTKKKSSFFHKFCHSFKFLKGKKETPNECNEMKNQSNLTNQTDLMKRENLHSIPYQPPYYSAPPDPQDHKYQECAINVPNQALYHPFPPPTAPPYYEAQPWNMYPQIPLCVKEVEVKSVGTQSDIKVSIFQRLGLKATSKHGICTPSIKTGKTGKKHRFSDCNRSPVFSRKQNTITEELQAALLKTLLEKSNPTPKYPWMKGFQPKSKKYLHQMMKYCKEC